MIPTNRNTTYTTASPVLANDLNDLQDCIIGAKRPSGTRWISPSTPNVLGSGNSLTASGLVFGASGSFQGMPLGTWDENDRITAFLVRLLGPSANTTIALSLFVSNGGSQTNLGALSIVNPPNSWATYSLTLATPHVIAAGEALYLSQTLNGGLAQTLGPTGITSDRL